MNGYGSHWSETATALSVIQMITMIVWPMMYCGVPKNRAACSAARPKASGPKVPWCSSRRSATRPEARPAAGQAGSGSGGREELARPLEIALVHEDLAHAVARDALER